MPRVRCDCSGRSSRPQRHIVLPPRYTADSARLAALGAYEVLDTPPEAEFDDIVQLAAHICAAPVSLVSLVTDERQWFKARLGFEPCETDLTSSVCAHALVEPDVFVVPDLTADPRTADNPLVTGEPHIRFYAGAPLRTPAGHVIGSLCVVDVEPRPEGLDERQLAALRALARQVIAQLELRRSVRERDELLARQTVELRRDRRLALLSEASAALLTATDPATVVEPVLTTGAELLGIDQSYIYEVTADRRHLRLTHAVGASDEARAGLLHVGIEGPLCGIVAETERAVILTGVQRSPENRHAIAVGLGVDAFAGYPITDRGRTVGVISFCSSSQPSFDAETLTFFETLARYMSAVRERLGVEVALRESDTRSRLAQEAGRIGTFEIDVETGEMAVSPEFCRLFGVAVAPSYPASVFEAVILPEQASVHSNPASRADGSAEADVEYRIRRASDGRVRWIARRARFLHDDGGRVTRMFGTAHDVTDRRRLQEFQAALLELGDRLRSAETSAEVAGLASEVLGRTLVASRAGYSRIDVRSDLSEIERDWTAPDAASLAGRHPLSTFGATVERLSRGETITLANVTAAAWMERDRSAYEGIDTRAEIKIPLIERGELVGTLFAHQKEARTWTADEVDFAHGVADRTYAALAKLQAEADQRVLNQELSHRLKNTLAMVQAIATQTLKGVSERDAVDAYTRRIHALSAAHDVLLQQSWAAARLRAVVGAVLDAFGQPERFDLSGPDINLGPRATLSLSLLLHELATNASKYGALSTEGGRVSLDWRVEPHADGPELVLDWTERGGPPPVQPERRGFGSRLIRMGLVGTGGAELRYAPAGFQAEFRAALAQVQHS